MANSEPDRAWQRVSSTLLLDRSPWLRVYADDMRLPNGRRIPDFLRVDGRSYAAICAITVDQQVLLVRQYKPGPNELVLQVPAGYLDEGETPEACARRELLEETGHVAERWTSLGGYGVDGNRGFGAAHLYLAQGARPVQPPDPGDDEELTVETIPLADLPGLLARREVSQLGSLACLTLALLHLNGIVQG